MIYITQLIYIKEGQENIFHQFEDVAISIISKYNGQLLLRIRPCRKHNLREWQRYFMSVNARLGGQSIIPDFFKK